MQRVWLRSFLGRSRGQPARAVRQINRRANCCCCYCCCCRSSQLASCQILTARNMTGAFKSRPLKRRPLLKPAAKVMQNTTMMMMMMMMRKLNQPTSSTVSSSEPTRLGKTVGPKTCSHRQQQQQDPIKFTSQMGANKRPSVSLLRLAALAFRLSARRSNESGRSARPSGWRAGRLAGII